jgi:hypothetical protein
LKDAVVLPAKGAAARVENRDPAPIWLEASPLSGKALARSAAPNQLPESSEQSGSAAL